MKSTQVSSPMGGGCGSVGIAVASNSRGPRFESSHLQIFIFNKFTFNCWKDENKGKEASGQSYKASTIVNYESRVVLTCNLRS